jgi:hypothetical protein
MKTMLYKPPINTLILKKGSFYWKPSAHSQKFLMWCRVQTVIVGRWHSHGSINMQYKIKLTVD